MLTKFAEVESLNPVHLDDLSMLAFKQHMYDRYGFETSYIEYETKNLFWKDYNKFKIHFDNNVYDYSNRLLDPKNVEDGLYSIDGNQQFTYRGSWRDSNTFNYKIFAKKNTIGWGDIFFGTAVAIGAAALAYDAMQEENHDTKKSSKKSQASIDREKAEVAEVDRIAERINQQNLEKAIANSLEDNWAKPKDSPHSYYEATRSDYQYQQDLERAVANSLEENWAKPKNNKPPSYDSLYPDLSGY